MERSGNRRNYTVIARGRPSPVARKQTVRATYGESSGLFFQTRIAISEERVRARPSTRLANVTALRPVTSSPCLSRDRADCFCERTQQPPCPRPRFTLAQSTIDSTSFSFHSTRNPFPVFHHISTWAEHTPRFDCSPDSRLVSKKIVHCYVPRILPMHYGSVCFP